MNAQDIVDALRSHYLVTYEYAPTMLDWTFLEQVMSYGLVSPHHGKNIYSLPQEEYLEHNAYTTLRSIDVLMIQNSVPRHKWAIEVKVSRSDFFRETDEKRLPWKLLAHRFIYAAPQGLIKPEEVPIGCDLIEIHEEKCDWKAEGHGKCPVKGTRVHWKVQGKKNKNPLPLNNSSATYFARRACLAELELAKMRDGIKNQNQRKDIQ